MTEAIPVTAPEESSGDISDDAVGQMLACAHSLRDKRIEYAYVFNEQGKMLYSLKGEHTRIRFNHRDLFRLSNTIFMHNHPSGGAFSLADMYVACVFEMIVMIVVPIHSCIPLNRPVPNSTSPAHYTDIARCFASGQDVALSEQLTVGDRVWHQIARDLGMEFRKYSFVKQSGSA
jgi:hypothetical protein